MYCIRYVQRRRMLAKHVLWNIIHKSREKHLANSSVKPCKGTLPKSIDPQRPGQRYPKGNPGNSWLRSRSDVVLVLVVIQLHGSLLETSQEPSCLTRTTTRRILDISGQCEQNHLSASLVRRRELMKG